MEIFTYFVSAISGFFVGGLSSYLLYISPKKRRKELLTNLRKDHPELTEEEFDILLKFHNSLKESIKNSKNEIVGKNKEINNGN